MRYSLFRSNGNRTTTTTRRPKGKVTGSGFWTAGAIAISIPLVVAGCKVSLPGYSAAVEAKFREQRMQELSDPLGDVSRIKTVKLKEGKTILGSEPGSTISNEHMPRFLAELRRTGSTVTVVKAASGTVLDGHPINSEMQLPYSFTERHVVKNGSLLLYAVLDSAGKSPTINLFDTQSAYFLGLHPLNWYVADAKWRVEGEWVPFDAPKLLTHHTTNGGKDMSRQARGYVQFSMEGKNFRLTPDYFQGIKELSFVFGDLTNSTETENGGRYLEIAAPKDISKKSAVVLDFNQAINPDCAYTPLTHCAIALPEDRLPIEIKAGEKLFN